MVWTCLHKAAIYMLRHVDSSQDNDQGFFLSARQLCFVPALDTLKDRQIETQKDGLVIRMTFWSSPNSSLEACSVRVVRCGSPSIKL